MDVEKLIRRLRNDANAYRNGETLGRAFADQEDVLDNAATALSTLQAENEKLKNKLSELAHLPFDEPGIGEQTRLMAENAELRTELEQVKAERDAAISDLNAFLSMDELCPIQCKWCKWEDTQCDGKTPEWRGIKEG